MAEYRVPYRRSIYWKIDKRESQPGIIVYSFRGLIRLNGVASLIWGLIDGHHTVEEILIALRDHFPDVPTERLREDLEDFLRFAEDNSLILRHWSPLQPYEVISEELVP